MEEENPRIIDEEQPDQVASQELDEDLEQDRQQHLQQDHENEAPQKEELEPEKSEQEPAHEQNQEQDQAQVEAKNEEKQEPPTPAEGSEKSEPPKVEPNPNQCEEVRKMFVGGLSPETTEEELKEHFEKLGGPVVDHCIIRKDGTDNKRLFGFVTFAEADDMDEVFAKRPIQLNGRTLEVKHAIPKGNTHPGSNLRTKKLFIANLGPNTCEDEIRTYLEAKYPSKYGTVETIQLLKKQDKKDENRGYGFVFVSSEDFADKIAIQEKRCEIGGRVIEIKKSEPKDEGGSTPRSGGAPSSAGYGYGPPPQQPGYYGPGGYSGYGGYYDPYAYSYQGYGYGGYSGYAAPAYGGRQYRGGYGGRQRFSPY